MVNYKQTPGRGNNSKTGHGIPQSMTSPLHQEGNKPKIDEKSGKEIGSYRTEDEIQKQYPGAIKRKGKINEYSYKGSTLKPGSYQGEGKSNAVQIKEAVEKKKKATT